MLLGASLHDTVNATVAACGAWLAFRC